MAHVKPSRVDRFFRDLGPGLITGCADDDPSGISTYSVAGAAFGYGALWTVLLTFPLMTSVQLMCARLGIVTGRGLAAVIRQRFPPLVLWGSCALLVIANVINIAADLGGMGEGLELITGLDAKLFTPFLAVLIIGFLFWSSYRRIARVFKWITLVLLAYVVTAFLAHVDWGAALRATFLPHVTFSRRSLSVLVAILGTTISPYLFFWQAAQDVEEEKAMRREHPTERQTKLEELRRARIDVVIGMLSSSFIMYFIVLTTAATLHEHGKTDIATAKQAAEALEPLAGPAASFVFAIGLFGTGMLGVPVLAGSSAYALAEAAALPRSLEKKPRGARGFYGILAAAMICGLAIQLAGIDAIKMMFWSAVINGALAPPLVLLVVLLTSDRRVMGKHVNSLTLRFFGWATVVVMTAATVGMLLT